MILAYHAIFSAYGFWLPNDPRGSWSDWVRQWELVRFGKATKVDTTRSVARRKHDRELRLAAKRALTYSAVVFDGLQARAVARGFAGQVGKSAYRILACSILPEHVHLVIARHSYRVEQIVNLLKGAATRRLVAEGLHPFQNLHDKRGERPSAWGTGFWKVFLDSPFDVRRAVRYVQDNPTKEGKRRQQWNFVTPGVP